MTQITFFTKPDCPLCDAALFVICKVRLVHRFELKQVDISSPGQERWFDLYRDHIPVVHLNDREIFRHRVDETALRRLLREAHSAEANSGP